MPAGRPFDRPTDRVELRWCLWVLYAEVLHADKCSLVEAVLLVHYNGIQIKPQIFIPDSSFPLSLIKNFFFKIKLLVMLRWRFAVHMSLDGGEQDQSIYFAVSVCSYFVLFSRTFFPVNFRFCHFPQVLSLHLYSVYISVLLFNAMRFPFFFFRTWHKPVWNSHKKKL